MSAIKRSDGQFLVRRKEKKGGSANFFENLISAWIIIIILIARISKGQDFRIDNQLRILANDCYTRIAIGSRLPEKDVVLTIRGDSLTECESACSRMNKTICNAFSFGINARGNGSCAIGRTILNPTMRIRDKLTFDPDYDVYERRSRMPKGCQHDRLLEIGYTGSGKRRGKFKNSTMATGPSRSSSGSKVGGLSVTNNPFGNIFGISSSTRDIDHNDRKTRPSSLFRGGWHSPIADDLDTRLYDIINNSGNNRGKITDNRPANFNEEFLRTTNDRLNDEAMIASSLGFFDHRNNDQIIDCFDRSVALEIASLYCKSEAEFSASIPTRLPFEKIKPSGVTMGYERRKQGVRDQSTTDHSIDGFPGGFSKRIKEQVDHKSKTCYRKLLAGKRLSENHVRRSVTCDRIEECHRVCEYESAFVCEGFNYGHMQQNGMRYDGGENSRRPGYMCQLTSGLGERMDPRRDFIDDSRYDYYERDRSCPSLRAPGGLTNRDYWLATFKPEREERRRPSVDSSSWSRPEYPPGSSRRPYESKDPRGNHRSFPYVPESSKLPRNGQNDDHHYRPSIGYLPQPKRPSDREITRPPPQTIYPANDYYYYYYQNPRRPSTDQDRRSYAGNYGKFDRRVDETLLIGPNDITDRRPLDSYAPSHERGFDYSPGRSGDTHYSREKTMHRETSVKPNDYNRYNYGPAYGYDQRQPIDSYLPIGWKPQNRQKWIGSRNGDSSRTDCSVRSASGFKISRKIVDDSRVAGNLEECEMLCASRRNCRSFAYRYSLAATTPTDNCLLCGVNFDKLDFYTDLEPDRDYDIYATTGDLRNCERERKEKPMTEVGPHGSYSEECFWRVRSDFGMPASLTRMETRVHNGIGACQMTCIKARHFTCRSFVFRYDSEGDQEPNCFLSDCSTSEIIRAIDDVISTQYRLRAAELYERGSYGRGCEAYPFATIYNQSNFENKPAVQSGPNDKRPDQGCYSGYQAGCKLSPYAVSSTSRVDSENECRRQCSKMRHNQHGPACMSFSFKMGDKKRGDNCYLSDVPRRDLRPGLDYTYDNDYVMYAWKELEPKCLGNSHPYIDDYQPGTNLHNPDTGLFTYNTLFLGIQRPQDGDRPTPQIPPNYGDNGVFTGNNDGIYPNDFSSFNRHYTVNGHPCKRGTKCEINRIVGFWSCEPEGSEFGSWDYCCEPNHHCGFSQGYRYPWCYVGSSEDQWRPCSEKYYPYLPSPRPAAEGSPNGGGTRHYYDNNHYHDNDDTGNFNPPGIYGQRENGRSSDDDDYTNYRNRDDGGRHWPIAFLHPVPPPNTTVDSIALANRRDDHNSDKKDTNRNSSVPNRSNLTVYDIRSNATPSPITINASISTSPLRLHKSHLKRRGLVTSAKIASPNPNVSPAFPSSAPPTEETRNKFNSTTVSSHSNSVENYSTDSPKFFDPKNDNSSIVGKIINDETKKGNFTSERKAGTRIGDRLLGRVERVTRGPA